MGSALALPADLALATPALFLIIGISFLAGFAIGTAVEHANLLIREQQLARGRRVLAAQARGLRQQLVAFYRLRDGAAVDQTLPEFTSIDHDDSLL